MRMDRVETEAGKSSQQQIAISCFRFENWRVSISKQGPLEFLAVLPDSTAACTQVHKGSKHRHSATVSHVQSPPGLCLVGGLLESVSSESWLTGCWFARSHHLRHWGAAKSERELSLDLTSLPVDVIS